ncbi:MAG: hypothetical protein QOF61_2508, partial [Acidobacteriota bacterium]|nr:hypothetical protein [Acidobacteriota bacterium]
ADYITSQQHTITHYHLNTSRRADYALPFGCVICIIPQIIVDSDKAARIDSRSFPNS